MEKKIAVLKGDGIGPEVVDQAIKVLEAIGKKFNHQFQFTEALIGAVAIDETGSPLPEETVEVCKNSDAILLGAIGDPKYDNDPEAKIRPEQGLLAIRKILGLFANLRPVKLFPGLEHLSPLKSDRLVGVDFTIFRELTGGIYFGEKNKTDNSASDLCYYEKYEIERIAHLAFKAAGRRSGKLCLVDKANVLESSRLWRKTVQDMSAQYPDVQLDYLFVDNAAMQIIVNPAQFDVVLTSNMFGDILSDEASVLSGSLGLLPSASYGSSTALYEPVHGSYPQAAGKDIANPLATILSTQIMLEDFGMAEEAKYLSDIISECIAKNIITVDINKDNPISCSGLGDYICEQIAKQVELQIN